MSTEATIGNPFASAHCEVFTCQALERCPLAAYVFECGDDLTITMVGGSSPHVGAVALAQAESDPARQATVSVLAAFSHRDDEVARRMAKRIAGALQCTVSASVGIHIDDATSQELEAIVATCDEIASNIIAYYRSKRG